ncbi:cell division control protein 14 [Sorochytrium milnesiophthora]
MPLEVSDSTFSFAAGLSDVIEFVKDRLYFTWSNQNLAARNAQSTNAHFFTVDNTLVYLPFFADFGPLNAAHVYRFIAMVRNKMMDASLHKKKLVLYSSMDSGKRANAAYLMAAYNMIDRKKSPEEAYKPLIGANPPFTPYRDAGQGNATYFITIMDCLKGVRKAMDLNLFSFDSFDLNDYETHERVELGDFNWITPKFIAFASPQDESVSNSAYGRMSPDDVAGVFQRKKVEAVVRLNNKLYDKAAFTRRGMHHYELYFQDGSCPPENILAKFLDLCEKHPGTIAVHCKAGLGRTGSLIGAYLMKTYQFTASEVIAFMRFMRPGCVVGPQQNYLHSMQARLWKMGNGAPVSAAAGSMLSGSAYGSRSGTPFAYDIAPMDVDQPTLSYAIPAQPRKGIDANPEYIPQTFAQNQHGASRPSSKARSASVSMTGAAESGSNLSRKLSTPSAASTKTRPASGLPMPTAITGVAVKKRVNSSSQGMSDRRSQFGI